MHALIAADGILRAVVAEIEKNPHKRVIEIKIKIGKYLFSNLNLFTSSWELIIRDTPLKDSKLTIEQVDGREITMTSVLFSDL
jgi:Zn finger protein HypA/HybF involved in hydrogenase expression